MLISSLFLWGVGHGCLWTFLGLSGRLPVMDQLCDFASILHQNVADWRIWGCGMWLMYAYGANWKLAHGPSGWVTLWKLLLVSDCLDPPKLNRICSAQRVAIYTMGPYVHLYHHLSSFIILSVPWRLDDVGWPPHGAPGGWCSPVSCALPAIPWGWVRFY